MSDLQALLAQQEELLAKIEEIGRNCEGIENENNAKLIQELNRKQAELTTQKGETQTRLNNIERELSNINTEITKLSGVGIDRILEAIKKQRWYFFKNQKEILMDRNTGLLWANLEYFPYNNNDTNLSGDYYYGYNDDIVSEFNSGGIDGWTLPTFDNFTEMIRDKTFPYQEGDDYFILNRSLWYYVNHNSKYPYKIIHLCSLKESQFDNWGYIIPCNDCFVRNTDYKKNISPDNHIYTEKERLQFTLDLFVQNELCPIFDDDEITQLYNKIYFEKPALLKQLQELQSQIEALQAEAVQAQAVALLSSTFDYTTLLEKYDIKDIDTSIIQYYQAVQQWTHELLDKLNDYEQEMETVIRDFNTISLKLSKKYENNTNLTQEENTLLAERQLYFQKNLSLGMHSVKSKIIAVKKQADDLEYRIDEIDNGNDCIRELALLEKEDRASFSFIAENTAKIVKNALLKIEYFQDNHNFVMNAIDIWEKWSENYRVFKTTYYEDLKASCAEDGIEEEIWTKWYEDWRSIRFKVEQKVQPMIERGLKCSMPTVNETEKTVPELLIAALEEYKKSIDNFFKEERKGIYQKFVFQSGGELQDKFETESELYKRTAFFQKMLQEIIFNCSEAEDRIFILKWANSLLDIQIDEILDFVADNDLQKISDTILSEFAALKQKNYDVYLTDAKAYAEEKTRREKEYNSLIFKMRKDLMKQRKSTKRKKM